jgi:tetratricopeptide (TPR) repeat protein
MNYWSQNRDGDLKRSSELAYKALTFDDSDSDALTLLSRVEWMQKRFDQAVAAGKRAVAINPNYAQGYVALSEALNVAGEPDGAIRAAEKAMRLDPSGQEMYLGIIGFAYVQMKRYHEAISVFKRHLAAYPNTLFAHISLVIAYEELGQDQDARDEAAEVMRLSPQFVVPPPGNGLLKDPSVNKRYGEDLRKAGLN